jgi:hypothetical protein
MKRTARAPNKVPRLNSLLHRLRQTPGPEEETYLDQLMMFLCAPPPDIADRWKAGAQMCSAWGIATTGPSVYRLFCSHAIEWRSRLALQDGAPDAATLENLDREITQLSALRIREMLSDPDADPLTVAALARVALQQKALELAQQKHRDRERDETERALDALDRRASRDCYAQFVLNEFKAALERKPPYPSFFPLPPLLTQVMKNDPAKSPPSSGSESAPSAPSA